MLLPLLLALLPQDDPRIARFESDLARPVVVAGHPAPPRGIAERMAAHGVPGVSVAVIDGGELVWARAYGLADVGSSRPVTTETLFQAASISKPVAALAALSLCEEGALSLDGDVNDVLEGWRVSGDHAVTVRGLLSHTAGLTVHGFPGYGPGEELPTTVEVLRGEGNTPAVLCDLEPGTEWRYSGGGYTVMQLLVEQVSGRPFADELHDRVLAPLGMTASTYAQPLPEERRGLAATAYDEDGAPWPGRFHVYPEQAAAGLWTTPGDLARYVLAVQRARAGGEHPVVSDETLAAMVSPGLGGWGLGPQLTLEGAWFGHGGANMGFRCQMTASLDGGQGAVIMTNSDQGGALIQELLMTLAREYDWPAPRGKEVEAVALEREVLDALAGRYAHEDRTMTLTHTDGQLWIRVTGDDGPARLYAASEKHLYSVSGQRHFVRYRRGAPTAIVVAGRPFVRED